MPSPECDTLLPMPLPPERIFATHDELYKFIMDWSQQYGYAFRKGRSRVIGSLSLTGNTDTGPRYKVLYDCKCSGLAPTANGPQPAANGSQPRVRQTGSIKTDCQFGINVLQTQENTWELRHRPDPKHSVHNHGPAPVSAFAVHRRFSNDQVEQLHQLFNAGNYIIYI